MLVSRAWAARPSRLVRFRAVKVFGSFSSTPNLSPRSRPSRVGYSRKKSTMGGKAEGNISPALESGETLSELMDPPVASGASVASETKTATIPAEGRDAQTTDGASQKGLKDSLENSIQEASGRVAKGLDQDPPVTTTESKDRLLDAPSEDGMPSAIPMARRFLDYQKDGMVPSWALPAPEELKRASEESASAPTGTQKPRNKSSSVFHPFQLPKDFERKNIVHIFHLVPRILEPLCLDPGRSMPPAEIHDIRTKLESTLEWIARHNSSNLISNNPPSSSTDDTRPDDSGLAEHRLDRFLRWSRFHHALSYFHLVITECHLKDDKNWCSERWDRHLPSLSALSMNREARLAAQVLLCEPRPEVDIREDLEKYISLGEAAVVAPPGINQALYAHVQDTILGHIKLVPPPKKEFEAPCTIINISFPGMKGPISQAGHICRELMQYIASTANASLLSLDPRCLAHVVGPYLGQDNTWASGPYSQLAYTTATTSGRIFDMVVDPREDEGSSSFMVLPPAFPRRIQRPASCRRSPGASSDQNQSSKWSDKPDRDEETSKWVKLKTQAAMESIIGAVDLSASENLIVHLDELVELSMSTESKFLGWKLENAVNKMRAKGKNVILVGTMAYSHPHINLAGRLQALAHTNTVINLPIDAKVWNAARLKGLAESQEYLNLDQNIANAIHVLEHMVSKDRGIELSARELDVNVVRNLHGKSLLSGILSQQSIFHLATIIVRYSEDSSQPIGKHALFRALKSFHQADTARSQYVDVTTQLSSSLAAPSELGENTSARKVKVETENEYEEKLVAGIVRPKDINTTFADVHVKRETVDALKTFTSLSLERPDAFSYGILATDKISGCLLYGPPGTGKTLLAKAVAKDSKACVLEVSGASIRDMWAGNSEKNVRAIFTLAKKIEPCVIFLDEADAILGHRSGGGNPSSTIHRDIINQFLREWDGVTGSKAFVMIATNRPFDLDDAVLRRVPRRILVDLPLQPDREAILKILLKDEQLDEDVSLTGIAKVSPFYSGSDLKNVCVTAAMGAVKDEMAAKAKHGELEPYVFPKKRTLHQRHFDAALKEISSSISEDMDTLTAIRKFDQQYGSGRKTNKRTRGMGFEVIPPAKDAEDVLVRKAVPLRA